MDFPEDHNVTDGLIDRIALHIGQLAINFALLENAVTAMATILSEGKHPPPDLTKLDEKIAVVRAAAELHPALKPFSHLSATLSEAKGLARHRGRVMHWPITEYRPNSDKVVFTSVDYALEDLGPKAAIYTTTEIARFAERSNILTNLMLDVATELAAWRSPK